MDMIFFPPRWESAAEMQLSVIREVIYAEHLESG